MNEHKYWVDWMKALGMLFIIWGHAFPEVFTPFIYSFNVPLFFIVSGYLYKRDESFNIFLKKNFISLIIPYLLLCLIKDFSHIIKYYNDIPELLKFPIGVFGGFHTFMNAPAAKNLWFVYTLFLIKAIFHFARGARNLTLCAVLCVTASIIAGYCNYHPLWAVTNMFLALPCFLFGYAASVLFREKLLMSVKAIKSCKPAYVILCIAILLVLQFLLSSLNGCVLMFKGFYGSNILLFYLLGLSGTVAIFLISVLLDNIKYKVVGVISAGTMVILQFHRDLYHPLGKMVKNLTVGGVCEGVLSLLASFLVLLAFVPIIMLLHKYFPLIIGNRKYK